MELLNCSDGANNGSCSKDISPNASFVVSAGNLSGADKSDDMAHVYATLPMQILFGMCTVVANLLTLLALSKIRTRFYPHLILVINLTLSDMMFGVRTVVFRSLWFAYQFDADLKAWFLPQNDPGCARDIIRVLGSSIYICTYLNLMVMAFDLYFAILMPFTYARVVTRRKTIVMSVMCWVLGLLFAGANYVVAFFHFLGVFKKQTYCEVRAQHTMVDIYLYLSIIYAGIIIMTYLYIHIFVVVRRCARSTPGMPMKQVQSVKRKKRKVVTSLLVLITFLIGWLPNGVLSTLYFIVPSMSSSHPVKIVGWYFAGLPMLNSICDPIIYAVRLDKVRIGFRRLCGFSRVELEYMGQSEVTEQYSVRDSSRDPSKRSSVVDKEEFLLANPTVPSHVN